VDSAERGQLALKIIRHDRDLPPDAMKEFYGDFMLAIGHLAYLIEAQDFPEANKREAAQLILSYASQQLRAMPDSPDDPSNPRIAAYALALFRSSEVAAALSEDGRRQLVDLLWKYARRENWVQPSDKAADINDRAFANALYALARPHFFLKSQDEDQRRFAGLLLSYLAEEPVDPSKAVHRELLFLSLLSRAYIFRWLMSEERRGVALRLLERAKQDFGISPRSPEFYFRVSRVREVLFILTREQILKALSESERREVASVFLEYATLERRLTVGDPGQIRIRIDPVVLSMEGLARKILFVVLPEKDAGRVALLMYKYASGEMQLDRERPEAPDTQILAIKVGIEHISREHVFKSLPPELQRAAAILVLKYARREKGVGSPHFPVEDLTLGLVTRAREALKREFVFNSLPEELRDQAATLRTRSRRDA